jgi:hypothetical protein
MIRATSFVASTNARAASAEHGEKSSLPGIRTLESEPPQKS